MRKNGDTAKPLDRRFGHRFATLSSGQVRLDIFHAFNLIFDRAGSRDDTSAAGEEAFHRGAAETLGAAADEHTLAGKFMGKYLDTHIVVSRVLMALCASVNR